MSKHLLRFAQRHSLARPCAEKMGRTTDARGWPSAPLRPLIDDVARSLFEAIVDPTRVSVDVAAAARPAARKKNAHPELGEEALTRPEMAELTTNSPPHDRGPARRVALRLFSASIAREFALLCYEGAAVHCSERPLLAACACARTHTSTRG